MSSEIEYVEKLDVIMSKAEQYVEQYSDNPCVMVYSAYPTADDLPVDNLDEIAIEGKCIVYLGRNTGWGGEESRHWTSGVLENPTWLELCALFNDAMHSVKDLHHCFLEGVTLDGHLGESCNEGVPVYEFCTGS